ncbi:IS1595 family transposase [Rhodovibrio sodomensis]|uniref:IS1595 family transposase n=1 Tax=Rhodovibrio sodomensis TaxID=1088 RepID=UPI003083F18D
MTTKTPLHATKLPLWRWIKAMWLMLSSSKGVSSVVLGRWVGVPQKTAWRMMQVVRELFTVAEWCAERLTGFVQVDTKYVGGAPRKKKNVKHRRGRGTPKPLIAVAVDARGFVRSQPIRSESAENMKAFFQRAVHPSATIVSDKSPAIAKLATGCAGHIALDHSQLQFAAGGHHSNTAEAFAANVERVLIGVYHRMSRQHLFRYVGEAACRWNSKEEVENQHGDKTGEFVRKHGKWAVADLLVHACGVELRRTDVGGVKYPGEPEPLPKRLAFRQRRAQKALRESRPLLGPSEAALRALVKERRRGLRLVPMASLEVGRPERNRLLGS